MFLLQPCGTASKPGRSKLCFDIAVSLLTIRKTTLLSIKVLKYSKVSEKGRPTSYILYIVGNLHLCMVAQGCAIFQGVVLLAAKLYSRKEGVPFIDRSSLSCPPLVSVLMWLW